VRLRACTLFLAVAVALTAVAPAQAGAPSQRAAVAAARDAAKKLARQTHASGYRVIGCRRSTPTRYVCQVENSFRSGVRSCTATVVVRFVAGRPRTSASNYVCY
jgi:hypothetical protein